jgi:hypothetical protein
MKRANQAVFGAFVSRSADFLSEWAYGLYAKLHRRPLRGLA